MTLDALVGVFLGSEDEMDSYVDAWERTLDQLNDVLRRVGLPEHHEPRSVAELPRPSTGDLASGTLATRLGFYSDRKYQRLTALAQSVAVRGALPATTDRGLPDVEIDPYLPDVEEEYDALPDRRRAFDHLIAATVMDTVLLPRPLDRVILVSNVPGVVTEGPDTICRIASADRLLTEAVALGYVLRYADGSEQDSPVVDWVSGRRLDDQSFAQLDVRIGQDDETAEEWANEANLCGRLAGLATDVLQTGAFGITG